VRSLLASTLLRRQLTAARGRFYCEREDEMRRKVDNLTLQCKELAEHRRVYHVRKRSFYVFAPNV
jgi:cell division protein FtsL